MRRETDPGIGDDEDTVDAAERGTTTRESRESRESPRRVVVRTMRTMPKPGTASASASTTSDVVVDVDAHGGARGPMTTYRRSPTSSS